MSVSVPARPVAPRSLPPRFAGAAAWAAVPARLLLAGVFGVAGALKIDDPAASVRAVRAYDLLPDWLAVVVGRGLPAFELALAVALLLGVALRLTAGVAAGLLTVFVVGISTAWARGLQIDCGCFGGGGVTDDPQYGREIARDLAVLVVAVALAWFGRSRLTISQRVVPGVVAAALLVAGGAGVVVAEATEPAPPTQIPVGVTVAGGIVVGSPDAPRTVVVYEDPQCPHCAEFERTGGVALHDAVEAGRVKVEYRMRSFLGPDSVRAVAALGAAQDAGKFDELRTAMFAHLLTGGGYSVDQLLALGASVGLTDAAFVDAVRDQVYAPWARSVDDRASKDGNTGTPALFLDGHPVDPAVAFDAAALARALA
ncbi:MauE/DoxX family redox-associated membrane protein [Sporichthya polymorpha]|uniref:MauE/DoxX family redox-associated membrane protein n=1 Tax=Sporichthya polymorpha TaxID=35751 RepID=UPI0009FFE286|nr:MauE/DoxX family redox-associated membrane protein [Sporichthya polymorpha]